jgi:hypothetical protein
MRFQTPEFNAPTARKWATPKFVASSQWSTRMVLAAAAVEMTSALVRVTLVAILRSLLLEAGMTVAELQQDGN